MCSHLQDSFALLKEAHTSLDEVVFGDPILAPATLAALLNYEADQLALPPEADSAATVLSSIQVRSLSKALAICHFSVSLLNYKADQLALPPEA